MKILELNFERTWRGGERQTIYNMEGLKQAGEEIFLLCRKGYPLEKKALQKGFKVYSYKNIFGVIFFLIINGRKFDILHSQTSHILTYCLITKPFHWTRIFFTRRVDFVPKGKLTKLKYRLTDKLIAISTPVKDIIANFSERNDVEVISDIAIAKELDRERAITELKGMGVENNKHIIGTTAALVSHKDPLTMVEAINKLALLRKDFVFLHFGAGDLEEELRMKIEEYSLQNEYRLMGFYENVEDFFSVFEVFVMSSKEEGLGSSILDAFLYKVPVVSTDAGGVKDIVKAGRGILCKVKDFDMLAKGINTLLDKKNNFDLISNAFSYVTINHSRDYITSQYLKLFYQ